MPCEKFADPQPAGQEGKPARGADEVRGGAPPLVEAGGGLRSVRARSASPVRCGGGGTRGGGARAPGASTPPGRDDRRGAAQEGAPVRADVHDRGRTGDGVARAVLDAGGRRPSGQRDGATGRHRRGVLHAACRAECGLGGGAPDAPGERDDVCADGGHEPVEVDARPPAQGSVGALGGVPDEVRGGRTRRGAGAPGGGLRRRLARRRARPDEGRRATGEAGRRAAPKAGRPRDRRATTRPAAAR